MLKFKLTILFLLFGCSIACADTGFVRGSGFNEGDLNMQKYSIQSHEVDSTPITPQADEIKLYACDDAGTTKMCTLDSLGAETVLGAGAAEVNNLETVCTGVAADEMPLGTAANTCVYTALPDCDTAATSKLLYDTTTHAFSCGVDQDSATAWDDIGDPDANSSIDFAGYTTALGFTATTGQLQINQTSATGTEWTSGNPTGLIWINDDRTGATVSEPEEATLVLDTPSSSNYSLYSKGKVRIDGSFYLNGNIFAKTVGQDTMYGYYWQSLANQQLSLLLQEQDQGVNNAFVLSNISYGYNRNFDHSAQTNPTFYTHSQLDPNVSNNQWGSLAHNQEDFIISTGVNVGTGTAPTTDNNGIIFSPRGTEVMRVQTGSVLVSNGATSAGVFGINEDTDDGTNKMTWTIPPLAADLAYTWPPAFVAGGALTDVAGNGTLTWVVPAGSGDMTKAVYDTNDDGVVDSDKILEADTLATVSGRGAQTDTAIVLGTDDTTRGHLTLYGGAAADGAFTRWYNSADEDTTEEYWEMQPNGTQFNLGINESLDLFQFHSAGNFTAGGNIAGATYGSDASVSNAELLYINSLSSNAQTQITAKGAHAGQVWTGVHDFGGATLKKPTHIVAGFTITNGNTAIDATVTDPVACKQIQQNSIITAWYLACDQSGSIVIDVWKNTWDDTPEANADSIASTEKPTLSSDVSASDVALGAMTTDWNAGDNVCIEIESAATVTKCQLQFVGYND